MSMRCMASQFTSKDVADVHSEHDQCKAGQVAYRQGVSMLGTLPSFMHPPSASAYRSCWAIINLFMIMFDRYLLQDGWRGLRASLSPAQV